MKALKHIAWSLFFTSLAALTAFADLSRDIEKARAGDPAIERKFRNALRESQLVFVVPTGALAAPTRSFQAQLQYLASIQRETQASFTELDLPFLGAWQENADKIAGSLKAIASSAHGRRLVVLGNPATGADALLALLRHPELVTDGLVSRLIVIQGAMRGVPAIDQAESEGLPLGGTARWVTRNARGAFDPAIASLSEGERAAIEAATDFVRSEKNPATVALLLRESARVAARADDGYTDGITPASWQLIRELGQDLGVISGIDHWGLTASGLLATTPVEYRIAFLKAVLASR